MSEVKKVTTRLDPTDSRSLLLYVNDKFDTEEQDRALGTLVLSFLTPSVMMSMLDELKQDVLYSIIVTQVLTEAQYNKIVDAMLDNDVELEHRARVVHESPRTIAKDALMVGESHGAINVMTGMKVRINGDEYPDVASAHAYLKTMVDEAGPMDSLKEYYTAMQQMLDTTHATAALKVGK